MNLGLEGKKVLITASVNGIGLATAKSFLDEGAYVMINGRNADRLIAVSEMLSEKYGKERVAFAVGDATDTECVCQIVGRVKELWGNLDVLVPCVGTGKAVSEDTLDKTEWEYMFNNNIYDSVELIRRVLPFMKGGENPSIVLVSSVVAKSRAKCPIAYAASKGAILTLNSYLAAEYDKTNIRVNCVTPGNVYFEGGRWEEIKKIDLKGTEDYITENVPMKRFGRPEEIADTIVFLASNRSSFTNGTVVEIDGGQNRSIR